MTRVLEILEIAGVIAVIGVATFAGYRYSLRRRLDHASRNHPDPELRQAAAGVQRDIDQGKAAGWFVGR